MPFRTAIPPSEINPTRLATVSDWLVITNANTPPMKAVGRAFKICRTTRTEGNSNISTDEHAHNRDSGQYDDSAGCSLLTLKLTAILNEVAFWKIDLAVDTSA